MSALSAIDGKLAREAPQHRKFTLALIALRAQARGYATKLGLQEEELEKSRKALSDFVVRLREALDQEVPQIDFLPLIRRMRNDRKSIDDWRKDLDAVAAQLQLRELVTDENLSVLEDMQWILDAELTQDLRRLRNREDRYGDPFRS